MLKIVLLILCSSLIMISFSQEEKKTSLLKSSNCGDDIDNSVIFGAHPEIPPEYKGGIQQLMKDINLNLKYPKRGCIEGRVFVSFVIDTLGLITNVKIAKGLTKQCDKEALRVVKLLTDWTPGTQWGKKIRVKYTIPINFKIESE